MAKPFVNDEFTFHAFVAQALHQLIEGLEIPQADKDRLLAMTPASYVGKAAELAKRC